MTETKITENLTPGLENDAGFKIAISCAASSSSPANSNLCSQGKLNRTSPEQENLSRAGKPLPEVPVSAPPGVTCPAAPTQASHSGLA